MSDGVAVPAGCPPVDATPVAGGFYRLVSPMPVDTQVPESGWRLPYTNTKGGCAGNVEECACHAYSVLGSLADAQECRRLVPMFKRKSIAFVQIDPSMGLLRRSPMNGPEGPIHNDHHDWWPSPADLVPMSLVVDAGTAVTS